ncbi:MAG: hypothetical protein GX418_08780 [Clostridiales bacterium]|nr:hypothetical protein [Clostridiales bacterium]
MELDKPAQEQLEYSDFIPDPEEETAPRDEVAEALRKAVRRRQIPADEDALNEVYSARMF